MNEVEGNTPTLHHLQLYARESNVCIEQTQIGNSCLLADGLKELIWGHSLGNQLAKDLMKRLCSHTLDPACPHAVVRLCNLCEVQVVTCNA